MNKSELKRLPRETFWTRCTVEETQAIIVPLLQASLQFLSATPSTLPVASQVAADILDAKTRIARLLSIELKRPVTPESLVNLRVKTQLRAGYFVIQLEEDHRHPGAWKRMDYRLNLLPMSGQSLFFKVKEHLVNETHPPTTDVTVSRAAHALMRDMGI